MPIVRTPDTLQDVIARLTIKFLSRGIPLAVILHHNSNTSIHHLYITTSLFCNTIYSYTYVCIWTIHPAQNSLLRLSFQKADSRVINLLAR